MKIKLTVLAVAFATFVIAGPISVRATTWLLLDASFEDSTLISGTFDFDASTATYSNWNVSVEAGSFLPAYTYSPMDGFIGINDPSAVDIVAFPDDFPSGRYIRFTFLEPLTDDSGIIQLGVSGESFECDNCSQSRAIVTGSVAPVVPEPASWSLIVGSALGILALRR